MTIFFIQKLFIDHKLNTATDCIQTQYKIKYTIQRKLPVVG